MDEVRRCWGWALATAMLMLLASRLVAVEADDLLAALVDEIPLEDLLEPGSTALAEALAGLLAEGDLGLPRAEVLRLEAALAEAWIGAERPAEALALLADLLARVGDEPALRERLGLALVACWRLALRVAEDPSAHPDALSFLRGYGEFPPVVLARAHSAQALRLVEAERPEAALAHFDQALDLLAGASPRARAPLYALRVSAMEQAGQEAPAIQAWLLARRADPAVAQVLDTLLTEGQKLIGRQAPEIALPRRDGGSELQLSQWRGQPVLVVFLASWSRSSDALMPVLRRIRQERAELALLGVTLDNADTLPGLPAWIARHGIDFPLVGEGQGWDGELHDQFHVDGLPHVVLVDAEGRLAAVGLVAEDPAVSYRRIDAALRELDREGEAPRDLMEDLP